MWSSNMFFVPRKNFGKKYSIQKENLQKYILLSCFLKFKLQYACKTALGNLIISIFFHHQQLVYRQFLPPKCNKTKSWPPL